jgi:hypothetical protein
MKAIMRFIKLIITTHPSLGVDYSPLMVESADGDVDV